MHGAINFVKKSICRTSAEDVFVCCGSIGNYETISTNCTNIATTITNSTSITKDSSKVHAMKTQHREYVKKKLLPSLKYCGLQHTDDRFYNETETALDEFPWLAHIVFIEDEDEDTEQYLDRCNGILINNKYVLTTEYCGTYA